MLGGRGAKIVKTTGYLAHEEINWRFFGDQLFQIVEFFQSFLVTLDCEEDGGPLELAHHVFWRHLYGGV